MLNSKNLRLAGWLTILSAVVTLPLVALGLLSEFTADKSTAWIYLELIFNVAYTALFVYIFVMIKRLLNEKAGFHGADRYITTIIALNVVIALLAALASIFPEAEEVISMLVLVMVVPAGVVSVIFGVKLLKCPDDLFGHLKPFAYLMIASGVMLATVILMLFAMLTSIAADIVLALIFFKSAKLMEK
jgi:hypothetical protein